MYKNGLLILYSQAYDFKYTKSFLFNFFISRNLVFNFEISRMGVNFPFIDWNLRNCLLGFFSFEVSLRAINEYKRELKVLVNNFNGKSLIYLLKILNSRIFDWNSKSNVLNSIFDVSNEIDVFLNKILWKWSRRRHPRRPNTWIYNKYWKFINNRWHFSCFDPSTGNTIILNSHFCETYKFYRIPLSLNILDLRNKSKINLIWFKKLRNYLKGIYKFLFIKQSGLCYFCRNPFYDFNLTTFKIVGISKNKDNNKIGNFVLSHNSCFKM